MLVVMLVVMLVKFLYVSCFGDEIIVVVGLVEVKGGGGGGGSGGGTGGGSCLLDGKQWLFASSARLMNHFAPTRPSFAHQMLREINFPTRKFNMTAFVSRDVCCR